MNFAEFEKGNTGFHHLLKDIQFEGYYLNAGDIIKVDDIWVRFERQQWEIPTYRIEINATDFNGKKHFIILYTEVDKIETLAKYFNSILKRISNPIHS